MRYSYRRWLTVTCASAGVLAASTALAQTSAPKPEPEVDGLAEIVVTAQRKSETVQRAAIAVTALAGEALEKQGVSDPVQLTKLVPALSVQPVGVSTSFFLRGVGSSSVNSFQENAIAFSVGGIFYARPTAPSGSFFDLDRIEVLKGPQGTLYGRNATGGAINLIPKAPILGSFGGEIGAQYGNYDTKKLNAAVNLPLSEKVALRLSGQAVDRDGYLSDGYDDEKAQAVRAQLLMELSDKTSLLLSADYSHQGGKGVGAVLFASPQTPNAPDPSDRVGSADPRTTAIIQQRSFNLFRANPGFAGLPDAAIRELVTYPRKNGYQRSEFWGVSATGNADLGFADLTTVVSYRNSKPDVLAYAPGFDAKLVEDDDQYTAEVRLSSHDRGQPLRYVFGAFYFHEQQDAYNAFNQGAFANTEYKPLLKTTSAAVFGQLTYSLSDTFRLVGGGRYTKESKTLSGATRNTSLFAPTSPWVTIRGDLDVNKFTWKAGFEFDAAERSLLYGNISTGFKAGGFYPSAGANTYQPETLTAYTLGSKNRFLDNRLQLNIEAFAWKYRDQQISYVGPIEATPGQYAQAGVTINAGRARMYGVETELVFRATHADTLGVTVQYLNAKYQSLLYDGISSSGAPLVTTCATKASSRVAAPPVRLFNVDCSGKPGINAPRWTVNLSYEHVFTLPGDYQLTAGVQSRLESSAYLNLDYLEFQKRGAYTATDAALTLDAPDRSWSLTGYVTNIEDKVVKAGGITRPILDLTVLTVRPPRTYGLRVGYKF